MPVDFPRLRDSELEAEFFFDRFPTRAGLAGVAFLGPGQLAAVIHVFQRVAQLPEHRLGLGNLPIQIRPADRSGPAFCVCDAH